jgi:hypothetical protein
VNREERIAEIDAALQGRRLVYFGTRGEDARHLLDLRSFGAVVCQIAPLGAASIREICLETLWKRRVDLDRYSIDDDVSPEVSRLRRALLSEFGKPAVVVPYRPTAVLTSAWFPRSDRVQYLGMFHEKQRYFEHKAWVETRLGNEGIPTIPWTYFADDDHILLSEFAESRCPVVLRSNRTDGGTGVQLARSPRDLPRRWPAHKDGFVGAAPFLAGGVPLNVNACVFESGQVSMHGPSLQIIGIPSCTSRAFGYCGNDFAAFADLPLQAMYDLEKMTRRTGHWLAKQGYRGAFGIDAIYHEGQVLFIELNARFQGSSVHSATIDVQLGRPDIFIEHIAACLGLPESPLISVADLCTDAPPLAHIGCHNTASGDVVSMLSPDHEQLYLTAVPSIGTQVAPEALMFDLRVSQKVTKNGMELSPESELLIEELKKKFIIKDN